MGLGRVVLLTPARPGYGRTPKSVQLCREAEAAAACLTPPVHLSVLVSLVSSRGSLVCASARTSALILCPSDRCFLSCTRCPRCKSVPSSCSISSSLLAASKCHFISRDYPCCNSWLLFPGFTLHALSMLTACHSLSLCLSPCIYRLLSLPLSLPIVEGVHGLEMSHPHWLTI